ncbi:MAG: SDR family oxidoreductase [Novosphingobium sp.]|nr:SDR family oxidoreductase [Novosphingobium sp.]
MGANLESKVVIVTGGGRGIGRAIADACAEEGAKVVVADRGLALDGSSPDPAVAEEAASAIRAQGGEALAVTESVAVKAGADAIIDAAISEWGRLDGVVCCAGILRHRPFLELTESDFDAVIATHLKGHFLMYQAALSRMVQQGSGGSLIGISSGYVLGDPARTPYRAAKAGIVALTKSVAMAGAEHKVRANVISPIADTRMTQASQLPIKMPPEDVAPMAVYLLSDRAAGISGEVYGVSGTSIAIWEDPHERRSIRNPVRWTQDGIDANMAWLRAGVPDRQPPVPPLPETAQPIAEPDG